MNLAQLIDPAWVQEGARRRVPLARPRSSAPATPARIVHEAAPVATIIDGAPPKPGVQLRIALILANAGEALTCRSIAVRFGEGMTADKASSFVCALVASGDAEKTNTERPFKYRITAAGQARVR